MPLILESGQLRVVGDADGDIDTLWLRAGGREHRYFEVPVRAAQYAKLPRTAP